MLKSYNRTINPVTCIHFMESMENLLKQRIAELEKSNKELKRKIQDRKKTEKQIRDAHKEIEHRTFGAGDSGGQIEKGGVQSDRTRAEDPESVIGRSRGNRPNRQENHFSVAEKGVS